MPDRAARQAGRVVAIYVAVGILWIFFSDQAVEFLAGDPAAVRRMQTLKGWFFILASGLLIFYLVRGEIRRRLHAARRLESVTDLLETTFRAMPDAVVILDLPGRVIRDANRAAAVLFGRSRDARRAVS